MSKLLERYKSTSSIPAWALLFSLSSCLHLPTSITNMFFPHKLQIVLMEFVLGNISCQEYFYSQNFLFFTLSLCICVVPSNSIVSQARRGQRAQPDTLSETSCLVGVQTLITVRALTRQSREYSYQISRDKYARWNMLLVFLLNVNLLAFSALCFNFEFGWHYGCNVKGKDVRIHSPQTIICKI